MKNTPGTNLVGHTETTLFLMSTELVLEIMVLKVSTKLFNHNKICRVFLFERQNRKSPLFLLDDVFGELDAERAGAISNYLEDVDKLLYLNGFC